MTFSHNRILFAILIFVILISLYYYFSSSTNIESNDVTDNDNKSIIIVSITTSPRRIKLMKPVIASIMTQSRPPDLIRINIPKIFKRFNTSYDEIPEFILSNDKIQIIQYEKDYGPIMKMLPTVLEYKDHPNTSIIYTDDDVLMAPRTIEVFLNYEKKYPNDVLCFSGFSFENINSWVRPAMHNNAYVDLAEGYMSVFLNNNVIKKLNTNFTLMDYYNLIENDDYCFTSDDLTISNFLEIKQIKKLKIYDQLCNFDIWWYLRCDLSYGKDGDGIMHLSNDQHFTRYKKSIDYLNRSGLNFLVTRTQFTL